MGNVSISLKYEHFPVMARDRNMSGKLSWISLFFVLRWKPGAIDFLDGGHLIQAVSQQGLHVSLPTSYEKRESSFLGKRVY